ncbi:MAG: DUF3656 domain-containing protein, partial [Planctomycetia bacterium]|nr:DUF3656 domain-containing protein [Planctomycetia bacterium]
MVSGSNGDGNTTEEADTAERTRSVPVDPRAMERLELTFSRGCSTGWLEGVNPRRLVPGDVSSKRGIPLGTVVAVRRDEVVVRLVASVRPGDGVFFEEKTSRQRAKDTPQGGRVFELFTRVPRSDRRNDRGNDRRNDRGDRYGRGGRNERSSGRDGRGNDRGRGRGESGAAEWEYRAIREGRPGEIVNLRFRNGAIDFGRLTMGMGVRKTDDPQIGKETRRQLSGPPCRRVPVDLTILATVGERMRIVAVAENGARCTLVSEAILEPAEKHPIDQTLCAEQFGRLGGTIFELREIHVTVTGEPMMPLSCFGVMRREMVAKLEEASRNLVPTETTPKVPVNAPLERLRAKDVAYRGDHPAKPMIEPVIHLHSRSPDFFRDRDAMEHCVAAGCRSFYGEFVDLGDYAMAVRAVRRLGAGAEFVAVTPRIQKPGEDWFLEGICSAEPDAVVVRNLAALRFFRDSRRIARQIPVITDFSLHVTNDLTATQLLRWGADRITTAYDLNAMGVSRLIRRIGPERVELIALGRVPMFFMEHCLWRANLVAPDADSCGRICRERPLLIQDRFGCEHPVTTDPFCRNIVSYADFQTAARQIPDWTSRGLRHIRLEMDDHATMTNDNREVTRFPEATLVAVFRDLANGELWADRAVEQIARLVPLHLRSTWSIGMPRPERTER